MDIYFSFWFLPVGTSQWQKESIHFSPAETSFQPKAALETSHDESGAAKDRGFSKFHLDTVILSCYSMGTCSDEEKE
ncbi:hypothetical protein [Dialister succinatiphilus]|uniref:hypothetical protein n=1 Tax=Dialister succinatiphilus TaxID=487173 RepID=UPI004027FED0